MGLIYSPLRTFYFVRDQLLKQTSIVLVNENEVACQELQNQMQSRIVPELAQWGYEFVWLNAARLNSVHDFVTTVVNAFNLTYSPFPPERQTQPQRLTLAGMETTLRYTDPARKLVLIIYDGFEAMLEKPEFDQEFFTGLKAILSSPYQPHLTMVLSSRRRLTEYPVLCEADFLFYPDVIS